MSSFRRRLMMVAQKSGYNEFISEDKGTPDLLYEGINSAGEVTTVEADIVSYRVSGWESPRNISELVIPSVHNNKPVTQIFKIIDSSYEDIVIDKLLIGSNITRIYNKLFTSGLLVINYMYIPSTVDYINYNGNSTEAGIFGSTNGAKTLYYNAKNAYCNFSISKSSSYTPWGFRSNLNPEIIIGKDVEVIRERAFDNEPIAKLSFDTNTKCHTLNSYCFSKTNIREVDIPKSVTKIEQSAFYGEISLVKATVRGNAVIENNAFAPYSSFGVTTCSLVEINLLGDSIVATSDIFGAGGNAKQNKLYFIRNLSPNSVAYDLEFQEELFDAVTPFANTFEIVDGKYWLLNTVTDGHINLINIMPGADVDLSDAAFTRILGGASESNRNTGALTLPSTVEIIKSNAIQGGQLSSIIIGDAVNGSNLQSVEVNGLGGNSSYQLYLYGTTPPVVVPFSFRYMTSNQPSSIKVPSGSVSNYQNNASWISADYATSVVSM